MSGVEIAQGSAVIHLAIHARRRSGRTRLVAAPSTAENPVPPPEPDAIVLAIARAFRWQEQIESGVVPSVTALAEREDVDEAFVRRQLRLTLHPPQLIDALVAGGDGMESIRAAVRAAPGLLWDLAEQTC